MVNISKDKRSDFIHAESLKHGIMVRNDLKMTVTIRGEDESVNKKTIERPTLEKKYRFLRIPIIRGMVQFIEGSINQFYANQISKNIINKKNEELSINNKSIYFQIISIILLAVLIYFITPTVISYFLKNQIKNLYFLYLIEIGIRFFLFFTIFYIETQTLDIKKSAPYHGAEHKTLFCYKKNIPLTIENIKKQSIYHPSCGTNLIISMIIFYIPFMLIVNYENLFFRILLILIIIPFILGLSFELITWAGNSNSMILKIISIPGLLLQRLNTVEPDDKHIEIAKISFLTLKQD